MMVRIHDGSRRVGRLLAVGLLALGLVSVLGMRTADAASECTSAPSTKVWTSGKSLSYQPGQFCMRNLTTGGELVFSPGGNLNLYRLQPSPKPGILVWSSNTSGRGESLELNRNGDVEVLGCTGSAGQGCAPAARIWHANPLNVQEHAPFPKYIMQIGNDRGAVTPCWTIAHSTVDGTRWLNGIGWTSGKYADCDGTYEAG